MGLKEITRIFPVKMFISLCKQDSAERDHEDAGDGEPSDGVGMGRSCQRSSMRFSQFYFLRLS